MIKWDNVQVGLLHTTVLTLLVNAEACKASSVGCLCTFAQKVAAVRQLVFSVREQMFLHSKLLVKTSHSLVKGVTLLFVTFAGDCRARMSHTWRENQRVDTVQV